MSVLGLETIKRFWMEVPPDHSQETFPKSPATVQEPTGPGVSRPGNDGAPVNGHGAAPLEAGAVGGDGILEGDGRKRGGWSENVSGC